MKSILLTSTALVAFAGAAAADGHTNISHELAATLGYNSENDGIGEDGFYWEGNLKTTASAELNNGVMASAYFEATIAGDNGTSADDGGQDLVSSDFVLSLTGANAGIHFGDTGTAANKHWAAAGDMESDGFTSGTDSAVLRGDIMISGVDASVSYIFDDANDSVEQLSFGAAATFGAVTLTAAYQEESAYADGNDDYNGDEIMGVSAATTFAGATVTLAYASNETDSTTSTGVKVSYPFGPVTATAYYVQEEGGANEDPNMGLAVNYKTDMIDVTLDYQDDQGVSKYTVEGTYDAGNGLTILAGILNENEGDDIDYYVGGMYDLGGGASVTAVYAADEDGDQGDEIGGGEYDPGATVEVTFKF